MALKKSLILRRPPPGPRLARPEDRLRGRLEGPAALIPLIVNFLTACERRNPGAAVRLPEPLDLRLRGGDGRGQFSPGVSMHFAHCFGDPLGARDVELFQAWR